MASQTSETKKTPLYEEHLALKAKMVPFGGWMMPVSYEGVLAEHKHVREHVGLFDVSHMGEIRVKGSEATKFLQYVTINDVTKLADGGGQYSAILNEKGGMIDDLIIYKISSDEYFICVNASNSDKDFNWIQKQSKNFQVAVTNESQQWSQIAVQGPKSMAALATIASPEFKNLSYTHIQKASLFGESCLIARTGYTGEWGYEIYIPNSIARKTWAALLKAPDVKAIGLGARDTLRLEACYLLYGNDMNDDVSPLEAGIAWATKLDKGSFIGRDQLINQKESGLKRKMFAFKMSEDGIPRHGMKAFDLKSGEVGEITSGSVLPTVGGAGGMALLAATFKEGDSFLVDIRGAKKHATIVKRPIYQAKAK
ncbi:MAG: glycine cleavage system aminomethyltransferase GcvT [Proteobacteria bacterium]|nr:glycine cleavage system aminomethyltransferase GcvT [Pseudomonadota bacterium]